MVGLTCFTGSFSITASFEDLCFPRLSSLELPALPSRREIPSAAGSPETIKRLKLNINPNSPFPIVAKIAQSRVTHPQSTRSSRSQQTGRREVDKSIWFLILAFVASYCADSRFSQKGEAHLSEIRLRCLLQTGLDFQHIKNKR